MNSSSNMNIEQLIELCIDETIKIASKFDERIIDFFSFNIELKKGYNMSVAVPCDLKKNNINKIFRNQENTSCIEWYPKIIEIFLYNEDSSIDMQDWFYDKKYFEGETRASEDINIQKLSDEVSRLESLIEKSNS